jgi:alcohol dehydrogenase, propanol-preferring
MRALELVACGPIAGAPLRMVERATPRPGAGQLTVRLAACAICRTDLQVVEGDLPSKRDRVIPGHQGVGRVTAVGHGVDAWSVGDRVGIGWLAGTCGTCPACSGGRENLCGEARFTGWDVDGAFATDAVVDAQQAIHLPDGLTDEAIAPLLCGGVIGFRSLRLSGIRPGGRLGLYGFGASASLAIQVARHWGCEVHVRTRSPSDRGRALALGATTVAGYDSPPPPELDAAITFAPSGDVVIAALRAVARGGTVAINAIHLDRIPTFPYDTLWWERGLRSVANYTRADVDAFLALATTIPIRTAVEVFPLASANAALCRLAAGDLEATGVLDCT